jgi:hypothetical protein
MKYLSNAQKPTAADSHPAFPQDLIRAWQSAANYLTQSTGDPFQITSEAKSLIA